MKYCGNCGNKLSDGDLFCDGCGQRIVESRLETIEESLQENQLAANADSVHQNTFSPEKESISMKSRKKPLVLGIAGSLVLVAAIVVGILFGKPIATQISYIFNPGVTATFKVQIPEGETEQQKTESMINITYITKIRLITLGYLKATVSADNNVVTVKHIPKEADISKVTDYITSSSYTAEIQDSDGNTIVDNAEFSSVLTLPVFDTITQYDISIFLTIDGEKALKEAIKPFADQNEEQNNIVLVANGKKIADLHISAEEAKNGLQSTMLSFIVPAESEIDLTLEELSKALNSRGTLPYTLSFIGITGKDATDSTKTDGGKSDNIDSTPEGTNGNTNTEDDPHPDKIVGTFALTDATLNVSPFYSESFTDYTVTFYKDGTYSLQGTSFHWGGTDEVKKYGHYEQVSEQGKWVYREISETFQPSDDLPVIEGIVNMETYDMIKSFGDEPMFYSFHFYIVKDKSTYDAYSIQGNYTKFYKKVS